MSDSGRHVPPGDRSFAISALTHLGAAVVLVLAVAAAFWGVGQVRAPTIDDPTGPIAGDDIDGEDDPVTAPTPERPTPTPAPQESPPATPTADDDPADDEDLSGISASDITIQLLDAAGDGGERMRALEAKLREDGFRVVATNTAFRIYEQSTVFYSPGYEDRARFVQRANPEFTVVDEKPDTLSASVHVHLVVGEDYPEP